MSVKVTMKPASEISGRILNSGVKKYAHTRLHAYCSPYVPMDTGMLDQTVDISAECVHYKVPYAHRQWTGDDFNFSKDKHPLATSHWERAAMVAKGQQLAGDITDYLKRR